jgi:hypothetical protein
MGGAFMITYMDDPRRDSLAAELAYCAGIIDGEGCIGIYGRSDRQTYFASIQVAMCEPQAIDLLFQTFGGRRTINSVQRKNPAYRPQHVWSVRAKDAVKALERLLPFLRIKKQQTRNALRLQQLNSWIQDETNFQRSLRHGFGPANKGQFTVRPSYREESEALYMWNRDLNRRGKAA